MHKKLSHKNAVYLHSEALKMVNYSEAKHILEATFSNNRTYHYTQVPVQIWQQFLVIIKQGLSAGTFINQHIKPFYDCIEIS